MNGAYQGSMTLSVEIVAKKYVALMSILINFPFVAGQLFMVLAAYLFRDYRSMIQFAFGLTCLMILGGLFIPESPRWLIAKRRYAIFLKKIRMIKRNSIFSDMAKQQK